MLIRLLFATALFDQKKGRPFLISISTSKGQLRPCLSHLWNIEDAADKIISPTDLLLSFACYYTFNTRFVYTTYLLMSYPTDPTSKKGPEVSQQMKANCLGESLSLDWKWNISIQIANLCFTLLDMRIIFCVKSRVRALKSSVFISCKFSWHESFTELPQLLHPQTSPPVAEARKSSLASKLNGFY